MSDQPRWDLVDLEDGRTWEVWRSGRRSGARDRDLFGSITVGEFGYAVRDRGGLDYGPFTTLDEAAYALTAREEQGDPILLGSPVRGAPVPADRPAETGAGGTMGAGRAPIVGAIGARAAGAPAAVSRVLVTARRSGDRRLVGLAVAAVCGVLLAVLLVARAVRRRRG